MNSPHRNFTLKDEIRTYWSERAASFDSSASHRIEDRYGMPEWHRLLRETLDLGPQGTLDGYDVLDIACGTGEVSRVLTGLGAQVTAVDFSEPMLDIARHKLHGQRWHCFQADAEALHPLCSDSFDLAVTRHLAWTLTDPLAAYAEWRRVLRPGAGLLVVDGDWTAARGRMMRLRRWLANRIAPVIEQSPRNAQAHRDIVAQLHYSRGLHARTLKDDLRKVGFTDFTDVPVGRLYGAGMRGLPLSDRLRQTAGHRFAVLAR